MSSWFKYANNIQDKGIGKDKLSLIPMLDYNENNELPEKIFELIREEFNKYDAKRIVIIDPYFTHNEFDYIVEAFAGYSGREIEIFTLMKSDNNEEIGDEQNEIKNKTRTLQKEIMLLNLQNNSYKLILRKIFNKITIYKVDVGLHDRYVLCPDNENLFFSLGGSFNTKFKKYSNIIRIKDFSFKMQVLKLYEILKKNSEVINEY